MRTFAARFPFGLSLAAPPSRYLIRDVAPVRRRFLLVLLRALAAWGV
jgi:hypothetical protein